MGGGGGMWLQKGKVGHVCLTFLKVSQRWRALRRSTARSTSGGVSFSLRCLTWFAASSAALPGPLPSTAPAASAWFASAFCASSPARPASAGSSRDPRWMLSLS